MWRWRGIEKQGNEVEKKTKEIIESKGGNRESNRSEVTV